MQTTLPGDNAYLPAQFRDYAELRVADLCTIFQKSRETLRTSWQSGLLPAPIKGTAGLRPRWSAAAINAFLAARAEQSQSAN